MAELLSKQRLQIGAHVIVITLNWFAKEIALAQMTLTTVENVGMWQVY